MATRLGFLKRLANRLVITMMVYQWIEYLSLSQNAYFIAEDR
jgi:hypothetical protein